MYTTKHLSKEKVKTWIFSHLLVGTEFPSLGLGGRSTWLGPEMSVDFDSSPLIMMVALFAVWSSLSRISKVMLGSMLLEEPISRNGAGFWAGSGVYWRGYMPSSSTRALAMVWGLCGGSDAERFLLMGILGGGSGLVFIWFSLPENGKR